MPASASKKTPKRPKIAFWFRYGLKEHADMFPALPRILELLSPVAEVHFYGMRTAKPIPDELRRLVHLHQIPIRVERNSMRDKFWKYILWLLAIPFMALHARFHGIDVIYIDETLPLSLPVIRFFFGRQIAVTVCDMFVTMYFQGWKAPLGRLIHRIDLNAWRRAELITTRAKTTAGWLVGQGVDPARIRCIYDPCDFTIFHPLPPADKAALREKFGFSPTDFVIAHHGILHPIKGNDLLLRAFAELLPDHPNFRFFLIGDGPEMPALVKLRDSLGIAHACLFTGWYSSEDVNRALNAADVSLVMRIHTPTANFCLTGALVHSMSSGCATLSTRLGGPGEVIREGENGMLFSPDDMEEWKRKVVALSRDPDLRASLGRAAAETARCEFELNHVARETAEALLALCGTTLPADDTLPSTNP
jgi:glycosyltransferase involved in cell wall biosynthesis